MPDVGARQRDSQKFITFSNFEKINTRPARQALAETDAAWIENLQLVAPNNLVSVPAANSALTTISGEIVQSMFPANIGSIDYIIVFTVKGGGYAVNASNGSQTVFAVDGTFSNPDMTVYASQRVLIADPTAGYSTWDTNAFVQYGGVSPNIVVTAGGSGYSTPPVVTISGGSGSGATATASISGGAVVAVTLTGGGSGYKTGDTITVGFSGGGGSGATATAIVWPNIACTTVAVFAGRVWTGARRLLSFTGTAGYDDVNPSNAAGSTTIADADLAHNITALRNLNNYLFIFGDNSVRQIGTITVQSSVTLFTPLILASDIGTSFARTILSYNRLVLFANKNGVYAIFGASVEKISDDLDGIFGGATSSGLASNIDFTLVPSAALNDIRNIHCYLLLVRYLDLVAGPRSIILVFQERKWFVVSQGNSLAAITSAELGSSLQVETFGSSGSDITQLLQDTTTAVAFTLVTSLTPHGNIVQAKQSLRAGVACTAQGAVTMAVNLDTENATRPYSLTAAPMVTWLNSLGQPVTWVNNSGGSVLWVGKGFAFPYGEMDGYGKFLGLTITGTAANFIINGGAIEYQNKDLWGASSGV